MTPVVAYKFVVVPESGASREVNIASYSELAVPEAWSMFKDEFTGSPRSKSRGFRNRNKSYRVDCQVFRFGDGAGWVSAGEKVFGKLPPRICWWAD